MSAPSRWFIGPNGSVMSEEFRPILVVTGRDPFSPHARAVQALASAAPRMLAELHRLGDAVSPAVRSELAYIVARWSSLAVSSLEPAGSAQVHIPEQRYGLFGRLQGD